MSVRSSAESPSRIRRAFGLELLQDRAAPAQGWLVAELDGPGHRQHHDDHRRVRTGEPIDQVGQVGGRQVGYALADLGEAVIGPQLNALEQILGRWHVAWLSAPGPHIRRRPRVKAPPS